jgi:hypothetical protein
MEGAWAPRGNRIHIGCPEQVSPAQAERPASGLTQTSQAAFDPELADGWGGRGRARRAAIPNNSALIYVYSSAVSRRGHSAGPNHSIYR